MHSPDPKGDEWYDPLPDPCPPPVEAFPDVDPGDATLETFTPPQPEPWFCREVASFHEAGHAVVGIVLMGMPDAGRARIHDDGSGQLSFGPVERDRPPPSFAPAAALSVATIHVAGFQCELLFSGHPRPGLLVPRENSSDDYPRARKILADGDLATDGWLWIAEGIARHILTTHWNAVWLIGHHLNGRGSLSGAELRRLYCRATRNEK